ncbi:MAG: DUF3592 domain-containing protein, partial [Bacteroidales bacterium]|nr:DUF3592 domain-containing protein [Bacteroidales bacterium]
MRIGTRPKTRKPGKANPIVLGLLFIVIGGFVFFMWGLPPMQYAAASKAWPSVPGKITRSEVETYRKDGKTQYLPDIAYNYTVDGKQYASSKVTVGDPPSTSNISPAKRLQSEYPVGKEVEVYYDPEVHSSSTLKTGIQRNDIMLAVITGAFPFFGILILGSGIRAKSRNKNEEVINQ